MPDESARLPTPVDLYVAYLTAEPTGRRVQYAKDVYAMDPALATAQGAATAATSR